MPAFGFSAPAPAAVDTPSVSASQFKDFTRCERLWWFHKVAGIKEREKQHFVIGSALHGCAERYQIGTSVGQVYRPGWDAGLTDDERDWVKKSVDYAISLGLWERIPGRLVEFPICMLVGPLDAQGMPLVARSVVYEDDKGVRKIKPPTCLVDGSPLPPGALSMPHYNGFIDFLDLDLPAPLIGDHKSAKSRRYALTPEKLAHDVQMRCYAAGVFGLMPEAQIIRLRHNVFLKDPKAPTPAYPVDTTVDRLAIEIHWQQVIAWSKKMQSLRKNFPAGEGPARADAWYQVDSAIQCGHPEECQGYGGCTFKDVCHGRCSAQQLLARIDLDPAQPAEVKFGLRSKETRMAFGRPAPSFSAGMDVYVLDPENPSTQYVARIDILDTPPNPHNPTGVPESTLCVWPNADIEPDFTSLGAVYRVCLPKSSLMLIPLPTAKVIGYEQGLRDSGVTEGLEWKPAVKAPVTSVASVPVRPPPEVVFGLRPSSPTTATITEIKADSVPPAPAPCPLPNTGAETKVGDMLVVAPSEAKFWKPLAGKSAKVVEIMPGEIPGNVLFSVEIDGLPYPDVLPSRFLLPSNSMAALAHANAGKMMHMVLDGGSLTLNTAIEAVYNDGFMILAGTRKVLWPQVESMELFDEKKHVPVSTKDAEKAAAKEEKAAAKAAAKEAAKVEKEAAKVTAEVTAEVTSPKNPIEGVNQAIAAVEEALKVGKTTRKVVEALMPPLKHLKDLLDSGYVQNAVPAPMPSGGDPVMRGAVKVALTHAIGVLTEAMNKIPE